MKKIRTFDGEMEEKVLKRCPTVIQKDTGGGNGFLSCNLIEKLDDTLSKAE